MDTDPVYAAFLAVVAVDAAAVCAASDILTLRAGGGSPPHTYNGCLRDVEHLERGIDDRVMVSAAPVPFLLSFPPDYCRSADPKLQFRVVSTAAPLVHPNVRGGMVCLGQHFRPGTRVKPLIEQIYRIVSGRTFATADAFDAPSRDYYLTHLDQVRSLRSAPLWRRPVTGGTWVERIARRQPPPAP